MQYRAEIDGLRALAVVPVILFHAGIELFSGGFVGVDVFFVISGYLITTIILTEKHNDTFSIIDFYERRARRILPVLFFIMASCIPFAWFLLLPTELKDFSQSLIAVSLFSSNVLFWLESGYWGAANELKPLLHTWSLAVEEQYYVLFPLFIALIWSLRKNIILSIFILVIALSLILSEWAAHNVPTANFFLLPTRAWEIAIGATIAFSKINYDDVFSKKCKEFCGFLGLGLIIFSIFSFNEGTVFPGFSALVPTIGTALIIYFASDQTLVGKLLSKKAFVVVGLLSYSAYLWHQPLFAFVRHASLRSPDNYTYFFLIALTFVLSYLSWKFIETPFRNKQRFSRRYIFVMTVAGSFLFIAIGGIGHYSQGFGDRLITNQITVSDLDERIRNNHGLHEVCTKEFTLSERCRTDEIPEVVVWGDSHAMQLISGLLASKPDIKLIQMTKSVCGPFYSVAPIIPPSYPKAWASSCLEFNAKVYKWLEKNHQSIKYVILSSPFSQYLNNRLLLSRDGEVLRANKDTEVNELRNTLEKITSLGITPVVVSPPPQNGHDIGKCLVRAEMSWQDKNGCNFKYNEITEARKAVYQNLDIIAKEFAVIRLDKIICRDEMCHTFSDDQFIYRDDAHLSYQGSAWLGKKINFYETIINMAKK